jgi:hypothetical protein
VSEREVRNLIIPEGLNQERVDAALSRLLGLSRNVIVGLIESDEISKDGKPYTLTNLESGLFPTCTKDIRSNAVGDRYCNDLPHHKKYTEILYKNPNFIQTKYPSYFYPPYSTRITPHHMFAPDWWHRQ